MENVGTSGIESKFVGNVAEKVQKKIEDILKAGFVKDTPKEKYKVDGDDYIYFALPGNIDRLKLDPKTCKVHVYRGIEAYKAQ